MTLSSYPSTNCWRITMREEYDGLDEMPDV